MSRSRYWINVRTRESVWENPTDTTTAGPPQPSVNDDHGRASTWSVVLDGDRRGGSGGYGGSSAARETATPQQQQQPEGSVLLQPSLSYSAGAARARMSSLQQLPPRQGHQPAEEEWAQFEAADRRPRRQPSHFSSALSSDSSAAWETWSSSNASTATVLSRPLPPRTVGAPGPVHVHGYLCRGWW
jgi:hypothetical protein